METFPGDNAGEEPGERPDAQSLPLELYEGMIRNDDEFNEYIASYLSWARGAEMHLYAICLRNEQTSDDAIALLCSVLEELRTVMEGTFVLLRYVRQNVTKNVAGLLDNIRLLREKTDCIGQMAHLMLFAATIAK